MHGWLEIIGPPYPDPVEIARLWAERDPYRVSFVDILTGRGVGILRSVKAAPIAEGG